MILLSKQTPLGAGRHRKCYTHPDNARRCIKVIYNRDHGGDKEIRRELSYYAHLSRYLTDWSAIPRYYGTVETDCGTGYVYDMITDFNGAPSITLTEFAAQCRYEEDVAVLRRLLKKLKRYLLDNHIVTMSLKPQNILCQRISESEVVPVVCDNLGKVPLSRWRPGQHGAVNANWRECGSGLSPSLRWPLPWRGTRSQKTRNGWRLLLTKLNGLCLSGLDDTDRRPDKAFAPPIGKIN